MAKRKSKSSLDNKIAQSQKIIKKAINKFGKEKIAVAWTSGKDSTVLLHLIKKTFTRVPFKVYFGDTTQHFDEVLNFRDKIAKKWRLDLVIGKPNVAYEKVKGSREKCCHALKTKPLNKTIKEQGWKAMMAGIRWDEQKARAKEKYFSPRRNPPHTRVHPLLHWTETDVWKYAKKYRVPENPLYQKGYRSIGCKPCTEPLGGTVGDGKERGGRVQDKEKIMQRLRALGYW